MEGDRQEVADRVFLSVFTGCDVTEDGNLEELLDGIVEHSREKIDMLERIKGRVASYERALAASQVPKDDSSN